jgi:hypothetical protein
MIISVFKILFLNPTFLLRFSVFMKLRSNGLLFSENVLEIFPLFMRFICSWPIRLTECGASLSMKDADDSQCIVILPYILEFHYRLIN